MNKCYPLGHIKRCRSQTTLFQERVKARHFLDKYELDNTRSSWRDLPKGVYVRHDVVSAFLLFLRCDLGLFGGEVLIDQHEHRRHIESYWSVSFLSEEIWVFPHRETYQVVLHLLDRFVRDGQPELFLCDRKV